MCKRRNVLTTITGACILGDFRRARRYWSERGLSCRARPNPIQSCSSGLVGVIEAFRGCLLLAMVRLNASTKASLKSPRRVKAGRVPRNCRRASRLHLMFASRFSPCTLQQRSRHVQEEPRQSNDSLASSSSKQHTWKALLGCRDQTDDQLSWRQQTYNSTAGCTSRTESSCTGLGGGLT